MSQSVQQGEHGDTNGIETGGLSHDDAFQTLSNYRRRGVVHFLLQQDDAVELRELSRRIAAWENDKPVEEVTSEERRRVYNALQQFHLPKMDDCGAVDYDSNRGTVELTERTAELQLYQGADTKRDMVWCVYAFLVGGAGAGIAGSLLAGPVSPGWITVAGLVLLLVLLLLPAGLHFNQRRHQRLGCDGPPPECTLEDT